MKIRTVNSPLQMTLVTSMGGSPTPVSWPEVYTSLATGVVEGTKNGITDIVGMKFNEHLKYMTLDGHAYMAAMWWMNNTAYTGMSTPLKKIVQDGFDALRNVTIVLPKRRQIEAFKAFKKSGGKIYSPTAKEKAEFIQAAAPVKEWFKKKYGDQWLKKTLNAVSQCETELTKNFEQRNQ